MEAPQNLLGSLGVIPGFMSSLYPVELVEMMAKEEEEEAPLDRAKAAARNHREAERRRRERIKCHLDRLRGILSCDAKMDKASLLAKAVEHMRDLKQQAAEISDVQQFPSEMDEISVHPDGLSSATGRIPIIKASLCCEDRSGLLPELAETLKSLRLRILRAEIATLGGRVRNVLLVAGEDSSLGKEEEDSGSGGCGGAVVSLNKALRDLVQRPVPGGGGEEQPKRRRVSDGSTSTIA